MDEFLVDIFGDDAFSGETLTALVNNRPFVPGRVGMMNLFEPEGVMTDTVDIESISGTLALVPAAPRGAPPAQNKKDKRSLRNLKIPHLPLSDTIKASELRNLRPYGKMSLEDAVQGVLLNRSGRMLNAHDATAEFQKLGALKGVILDADGTTVLLDSFAEFGVTQLQVDFDLGNDDSDIEGHCEELAGNIEDVLGVDAYDHVHVFCGKTFWRAFISHPKVAEAYKFYQQTDGLNPLRQDLRYKGFTFGGVTFEQYRGKVNGIQFVADAEAYAFPVGVPGLYISRYAPAEYFDTVTSPGLPRYMRQFLDPKLRYVEIDTESNPIHVCTKPGVLNKLYTSS